MIPASVREMIKPPPGLEIDFTSPPGASSLVPYGGVSWKIFGNPVTVFIGGVAAVLLELAEPSVRSGVWDHSSFRADPCCACGVPDMRPLLPCTHHARRQRR